MDSRIDQLIALIHEPDCPWRVSTKLTRPQADQLAASLIGQGIKARVIDGQGIASKRDLLTAIAKAFGFPGHFGHNWDALLDCLTDFHWLPAKGYVCILLHADQVRAMGRDNWKTFLEVCSEAAVRWAARGGLFKLVTSG